MPNTLLVSAAQPDLAGPRLVVSERELVRACRKRGRWLLTKCTRHTASAVSSKPHPSPRLRCNFPVASRRWVWDSWSAPPRRGAARPCSPRRGAGAARPVTWLVDSSAWHICFRHDGLRSPLELSSIGVPNRVNGASSSTVLRLEALHLMLSKEKRRLAGWVNDWRLGGAKDCSFGWWLMVGVDLFWEKSIVGWLLMAGLFWEKSTAGWWLISQTNRAECKPVELLVACSFFAWSK
jgi:hypothetical protein